jgi:segregation and condensation protein A
MQHFKVEQFEGPLDLLLSLIEEEGMDITKISLSKVTDQYLSYMAEIEELNPLDLADFLVVATRLLHLKSKALMPYLIWGEDEEGESLETQLKLYKEFLEASKKIQEILDDQKVSFGREKIVQVADISFSPPTKLHKGRLMEYYMDVLSKLDPIFKLPKRLIEKTISLKEKILQIKDLITRQKKITFDYLSSVSKNRSEFIVNFLAVLELVKQREVMISQEILFEEIIIEKI